MFIELYKFTDNITFTLSNRCFQPSHDQDCKERWQVEISTPSTNCEGQSHQHTWTPI